MGQINEEYIYSEVENGDASSGKKKNLKFLYISACTANLLAYTCGLAFGWTSPTLPKLESNSENPLPEKITMQEASWIGSLLPLGAAIGPFMAGFVLDKIGRKNTLLISALPIIAAFGMSAYANHIVQFYIARFLCGISVGAIFTVLPIYIGEISDDEVRSSLGSFMQLFIVIGLLFSFSVGPFVSIKSFNLICTLVPIMFIFIFYAYIPESPHFRIAKKDINGARRSLQKLRGTIHVEDELLSIQTNLEEAMLTKAGFMDIFKSYGLKKAFILSIGLVSLQQFSGINVILFYTESIFSATGSTIPPAISTIIIGAVQVVGSFTTPMVVEKKGKRFLLIASALFMGLSQLVLGGYFYYKDNNHDVSMVFWLPVACLVVYMFFYCLGLGPLPWAVMGELFPASVKSSASTATASGCWVLAFFLTLYFGDVTKVIGICGSFWVFAGFCAFAIFFVYKYLPKTEGMSLQEIQDVLAKRN